MDRQLIVATVDIVAHSKNDPGLTLEGQEMAQAFADAYCSIHWLAAYVSPLKRAIQTAMPICTHAGLKMQLRKGLQEIDYGKWEGMHPDEITEKYHDDYVRWLTDPAWNAPPDGERGIDIARRASLVLEEIEHSYHEGNVLLVSHKATIRIMLCELMGIDNRSLPRSFCHASCCCKLSRAIKTRPTFSSNC